MSISPSLLSILLHQSVLKPGLYDKLDPREILRLVGQASGESSPLPFVSLSEARHAVGGRESFDIGALTLPRGIAWRSMTWGRTASNVLAESLGQAVGIDSNNSWIDCGGPCYFEGSRAGTLGAELDTLLDDTSAGEAKVELIVVDQGAAPGALPTHPKLALWSTCPPAPHALQVLRTALEVMSLAARRKTRIAAAFIEPSQVAIGLTSLRHAWTPEILSALKLAETNATPNLPVVLNLSFGTHAGSHEESNPIDLAVAAIGLSHSRYPVYAVTSAGNCLHDPVSSVASADANDSAWFGVDSRGATAKEVLVELWFTRPPGATAAGISVDATVFTSLGARLLNVSVNATNAPGQLSRPQHLALSVYLDLNAPGGMACATVMMSDPTQALNHRLMIEVSSAVPLIVDAWLVVGRAEGAVLSGQNIGGGPTTPGCRPQTSITVGAFRQGSHRVSWFSAVGPASQYLDYVHGGSRSVDVPTVAAQDTSSSTPPERGTSFAAARTSAACVELLVAKQCSLISLAPADPDHMIDHLLRASTGCADPDTGHHSTKLTSWSPSRGWGQFQ